MPRVSRQGVSLHYADSGGDGQAVLFHTGAAGDGTMWADAGYTEVLGGRRPLLMDHRGHGRSDHPEGVEAHRLQKYVEDLVAVLDHARVDRAVLVGYSDGALVAYAAAAFHPERVSAVVGIGGVDPPSFDVAGRVEEARSIRQDGIRAVLEALSEGEDEPPPEWLMNTLCTTTTEMFALEIEGWSTGPDAWALFPAIAVPTLIICGEREDHAGASALAARALRHGASVVVPDFGHLQIFWHGRDVTGPLIREFLAGTAPR